MIQINKKSRKNRAKSIPKDPFGYVACWQLMTFIMLLLLIWVSELRDMPALLFDIAPVKVNYVRGCVLSAGVFITAVIAIGNTYLQQKRVLTHLISVCSNCHKVRVNEDNWNRIEDYVSENSPLIFTHGLCPECMANTMEAIEEYTSGKSEAPVSKLENNN